MESFLTSEEKTRIKQEEIFRAEIRKEVAPSKPSTTKERVWKFLNSTILIWLLSTLVVTYGATWFKDQLDTARADAAKVESKNREKAAKDESERAQGEKNKATQARVGLEIAYRFSSTMSRLKAISDKYKESANAESQQAIVRAFDPLQKPATDDNPPLYPEYKLYNGVALIAEMRNVTPDVLEKKYLAEVLAKTSGLLQKTIAGKPGRTAEAVADDLLTTLYSPYWSNNGFPYTKRCDDKALVFC